MGKNKGKKNSGSNPKHDKAPVVAEITEPFQSPTSATPGDLKLQRQLERQEREAREEEERKKAENEKKKQEQKDAKKKNKSSASAPKPSPTKENPKSKSAQSSEVAVSTQGEWNVEDTEPNALKLDQSNICENWEDENATVVVNKMEIGNSCQELPTKSVKINRNFDDNEDISNIKKPFQVSPERTYSSPTTDVESSPDQKIYSKRSDNDWRYKSENSRVSAPNYNNRNSYNKFSNKGSTWNQSSRYSDYSHDGRNDPEFQEFINLSRQRKLIDHNKLKEIKGDLFSAPEDYALAHCVAEDMSMGAGIAKTFRTKFGRVGELLNQRARTGGLAVLVEETRYIYYLVTKHLSRSKPTNYTLWQSLHKMRDHIQENKVTKLAIPQIGCGLDRLDWDTVSEMLEHVFRDTDIEIVVYIWDESLEEAAPKKLMKKCFVAHEQKPLLKIQADTGLLYFGSSDSYETDEFKYLANEFNLVAYKTQPKYTDILKCMRHDFYVYGLIIRQRHTDIPDYEEIEKIFKQLKKILRQDKTHYVAFQAFKDDVDKLLQEKLISLMQYIFVDVEIYVCWPDSLADKCPQQSRSYY